MTTIFFIADTHFGKKYNFLQDYELGFSERNLDVIENCERIIKTAIEEKPDYVIFLGDVYERQMISPTIRKIVRERIFIPLFENNIQVIILGGNHDSPRNLQKGSDLLELSSFPNVKVITEPQPYIDDDIGFLFMPYLHFDVLVDIAQKTGIDIPEGKNNYVIAQRIIDNLVEKLHKTELQNCEQNLLIGHYYLDGAKIRETNNPTEIYGEFKFNKQMVHKELFDLVMFGHVHLKQTLWNDDRVVILGSIDRLDFGERDSDKFYCVYEVEEDNLEFREIECRKLMQMKVEVPDNEQAPTEYIIEHLPKKADLTDVLFRLNIVHSRGQEVQISSEKLKDHLSNTFYTDINYKIRPGEDEPHLRDINLDPLNLFKDYLAQKYDEHEHYEELKKEGIELIKKEMSSIGTTAKGPLSIKSVTIRNFNKYGKNSSKIEFEDDIYVIRGPTGSGKSSILDAVTYALFKRSTRRDEGMTIDEILYEGGRLELEVLLGEKILKIIRANPSPRLKIYLDGKELYKGKNMSEKEDKIEEMIGYTYDAFISSFFIRQQELQIFSTLKSSERQERLTELFKLEIFRDITDELKTTIDTMEAKKTELEGEVKAYKKTVEPLSEHKENLKNLKGELAKLNLQLKRKTETLENFDNTLSQLKPKKEKYKNQKVIFEQKQQVLSSNKEEIQESKAKQKKYKQLQEKLKDYKGLTETRNKLDEQKEIFEKKRRKKNDYTNRINTQEEILNTTRRERKSQVRDISQELETISKRLEKLEASFSKKQAFKLLKNIGSLSERLERLTEIEIPMAQDYDDQERLQEFEHLKEETKDSFEKEHPKEDLINEDIFKVEELQSRKQSVEHKLQTLQTEFDKKQQDIQQKIEELKTKLKQEGLDEDFNGNLIKVKDKLDDIKEKEQEKQEIEKNLEQTKDFSSLIEKLQQDNVELEQELDDLKENLKELKPHYEKYQEIEQQRNDLKESLTELKESIAGRKAEVEGTKEIIKEIEQIQQEVKKTTQAIDQLKFDIEIRKILREDIFHLNGVPSFAIDRILPAISIQASNIVSDLSEGKLNQINFRPVERENRIGFDICVHDGERERLADTFSGGEKTQINAAIRFAIMERISEIPDTTGAVFRKSDTLFIDEGDLGTLDTDSARQRFVDKIIEMQEIFKKIILITHLEDVAKQFSNQIHIAIDEKTGKSKIL